MTGNNDTDIHIKFIDENDFILCSNDQDINISSTTVQQNSYKAIILTTATTLMQMSNHGHNHCDNDDG